MRFWDSSAIVPLLVEAPASDAMLSLLETDEQMTVWWGTPAECVSAVARRERDGLSAAVVDAAAERLRTVATSWREIAPDDAIRETAQRLRTVHALRGADALQLAAAVVAAEHETSALPFVCLDETLARAAEREGFRVLRG